MLKEAAWSRSAAQNYDAIFGFDDRLPVNRPTAPALDKTPGEPATILSY